MQKTKNTIFWAVILSETGHVFCCVLPTVFSVLSLLAGLGMVSAVPVWMEELHHVLHDWEIPVIVLSGFLLMMGWALHAYSRKIDCHETGCHHPPCDSKKTTASRILVVATTLFCINLAVYVFLHR